MPLLLLSLAYAESVWFAQDFAYPKPPKTAAVTTRLADARSRLQAGDVPGADAQCDAAVQLDASFPPAHLCRGVARMFLGDLATAEAEVARSLALDPGYAMAMLWRGRVRSAQGKVDAETFQVYVDLLALHPDEPVVLFEGAQVALTLARTDTGAREQWYAKADGLLQRGLGLPNAAEAPGLYTARVLWAEETSNPLGASMAWDDAARAVKAGTIPDSPWMHLMRVRIAVRAILDADPAVAAVVLGGWCADHPCRKADPATAPVPPPEALVTVDLGGGYTTTEYASNDAAVAYFSAVSVHAMRATPPAEYHAWLRAELDTLQGHAASEAAPWRVAIDVLDRKDDAARAAVEAMPDRTEALTLFRMARQVRDRWNPK